MTAPRTLILGTAGHVDHGKTALVRALTGTDTDRLEEEHRRGISIELGFAHLQLSENLRLGVVDVPGHERFVRQMVAGAGGMDLALLLVAADEGVMPQTREHLDVLKLLGVGAGLVALTKIDLADPELVEVVAEEVEELVAGSFLEGAPMLRVSAVSGEGLDALRAALVELAEAAPDRSRAGDFRLPLDRVFVLPGAGVVVTGTAWAGRVRVGDNLRLMPEDESVRVREVQSHGEVVEEAGAGERVALALHGLKREGLVRGDQLVGGTAWRASRQIGIRVTAVESHGAPPLRQRVRLHVHHAAREVLARLDLLEATELAPQESALARLHLEEPLVARPGDRLVLRSYSPMLTVGGGVVLDPFERRGERRKDALHWLRRIEAAGAELWPLAELGRAGLTGRTRAELAALHTLQGRSMEEAETVLERDESEGRLLRLGERLLASEAVEEAAERALRRLRAHQKEQPLSPGLPKEELRRALGFGGSAQAFTRLLEDWAGRHPVFPRGDRVRADAAEPELDPQQRARVEALETAVAEARPAFQADERQMRSPELALLVGAGRVVKLGGRLLAHRTQLDELVGKVAEHFADQEILDVAQVKDWTGASRKYVVPLMEWLDAQEITRFDATGRRRGPACP